VTTSQISGLVYEDLNANGVRDADEPGMGGWTVTLTGPAGSQATLSDGTGNFVFGALPAGDYVLCQMQPGGAQTYPWGTNTVCAGAAGYQFTLTEPVNLAGFDFGNWL
jgi:hypothetical protein